MIFPSSRHYHQCFHFSPSHTNSPRQYFLNTKLRMGLYQKSWFYLYSVYTMWVFFNDDLVHLRPFFFLLWTALTSFVFIQYLNDVLDRSSIFKMWCSLYTPIILLPEFTEPFPSFSSSMRIALHISPSYSNQGT